MHHVHRNELTSAGQHLPLNARSTLRMSGLASAQASTIRPALPNKGGGSTPQQQRPASEMGVTQLVTQQARKSTAFVHSSLYHTAADK